MHFIIISKKENFKRKHVNDDYLNSNLAPSIISNNHDKIEIINFTVYIYLYDQIEKEKKGYSYYGDKNRLLISNGLLNIDNKVRKENIEKLFDDLNESSKITGDYQIISIDSTGNGFFKTPKFGLKQLYFYSDENCTVLSTEIKLIVDGIQKFKEKKFVENFDIKFMKDSIYNEWGVRKFPKHTIFKNIKRISPHDEKKIINGTISIEEYENIKIPEKFEKKFKENKNLLYDEYYKELVGFIDQNLERLKPNISKISLGLTGGFDSRMAISILHKLCNKHEIPLECHTSGVDDHPDVVIAKKIAKALNIDHVHNRPQSGKGLFPQKLSGYMNTFYSSQGDFNSNDFQPVNRKIDDFTSINH